MGKKIKAHSEGQDEPEQSPENNVQDNQAQNSKSKKKNISKKRQTTGSPKANKKPEPRKKKDTQEDHKNSSSKPKSKTNGKSKDQENQDKKADFLPGQKHPTPEDDDPLFAFYKSLYDKNPKSEMARKYCLEYGVLQAKQAQKLLKQMVGKKK